MENTIKIVLAVLFFLCLLSMPYAYYELVRFSAFVGFGILAYTGYKNDDEKTMFTYIALALLFQPFFKIALGRVVWNTVDVIVAIGLLISLKNSHNNKV